MCFSIDCTHACVRMLVGGDGRCVRLVVETYSVCVCVCVLVREDRRIVRGDRRIVRGDRLCVRVLVRGDRRQTDRAWRQTDRA